MNECGEILLEEVVAQVHHEVVVTKELLGDQPSIMLTGHCGNWELLGYTMALLGFPMHALYRPLDLRPMDQWVSHRSYP